MKLDFLTLPEEFQTLSIRERMRVYSVATRAAKVGGKLALVYFVSVAIAISVAGLAAKHGGSGDLVLGLLLVTLCLAWFIGYFYVVNKYLNPKLVEAIEQHKH